MHHRHQGSHGSTSPVLSTIRSPLEERRRAQLVRANSDSVCHKPKRHFHTPVRAANSTSTNKRTRAFSFSHPSSTLPSSSTWTTAPPVSPSSQSSSSFRSVSALLSTAQSSVISTLSNDNRTHSGTICDSLTTDDSRAGAGGGGDGNGGDSTGEDFTSESAPRRVEEDIFAFFSEMREALTRTQTAIDNHNTKHQGCVEAQGGGLLHADGSTEMLEMLAVLLQQARGALSANLALVEHEVIKAASKARGHGWHGGSGQLSFDRMFDPELCTGVVEQVEAVAAAIAEIVQANGYTPLPCRILRATQLRLTLLCQQQRANVQTVQQTQARYVDGSHPACKLGEGTTLVQDVHELCFRQQVGKFLAQGAIMQSALVKLSAQLRDVGAKPKPEFDWHQVADSAAATAAAKVAVLEQQQKQAALLTEDEAAPIAPKPATTTNPKTEASAEPSQHNNHYHETSNTLLCHYSDVYEC